MPLSKPIYIGIRGSVVALDRGNGAILWQTPLKGPGFVNVVLDDALIFATTRGEVFCLEAATGRILWNNPMKGFGYGLAGIAAFDVSEAVTLIEQASQEDAAAASSATASGSVATM